MTVKHRDDLDKLIFLLAHLIETQNGKKITDDNLWLGDAQILSVKFFRHVATVGSIARGIVIEFPSGGFVKHVDHSSI